MALILQQNFPVDTFYEALVGIRYACIIVQLFLVLLSDKKAWQNQRGFTELTSESESLLKSFKQDVQVDKTD